MLNLKHLPSHSPSRTDLIGDLLVTFGVDSTSIEGRGSCSEWVTLDDGLASRILTQRASREWRGYPFASVSKEDWQVWLLGELYGLSEQDGPVNRLLLDVAGGERDASLLNGHFLLVARNHQTRQWHIWTDRFATLHAYYAAYGAHAAFGTSFASVAQAASHRELDWEAITGFFAFGFFPQDRTYFTDVRILRPASHYVLGEDGRLLHEERYWQWRHEPDRGRSYEETLDEFAHLWTSIIREQTGSGRIALPISGGLDSRSTVAALNGHALSLADDNQLWSYSYGYTDDSAETKIARRVAATHALPFQSFTINSYLFDNLEMVLASVEGFQDVTQSRQAAVLDQIREHADYLIAAHWGDVWMDDMGLAGTDGRGANKAEVLSHTLRRISKGGHAWLLDNLCRQRVGQDAQELLHEMAREEMERVEHLEDADFRVKAFKTEQWSFRWTLASLRMFQPAAFPRLPFYDTRLADFFCTVPTEFIAGRRLQIDYLKKFAPDLARVTWQAYDTSLFRHQYFNSLLLPKRALKKFGRAISRKPAFERNWEVQFLNEEGRGELERHLLSPRLKIRELIPAQATKELLSAFYAAPLEQKRGYTVSMLLTFAVWLERYG